LESVTLTSSENFESSTKIKEDELNDIIAFQYGEKRSFIFNVRAKSDYRQLIEVCFI